MHKIHRIVKINLKYETINELNYFPLNISTYNFWQHNKLCEFTALEHKFKRWFNIHKTFLKISGIQK